MYLNLWRVVTWKPTNTGSLAYTPISLLGEVLCSSMFLENVPANNIAAARLLNIGGYIEDMRVESISDIHIYPSFVSAAKEFLKKEGINVS